MQNLFPRLKNCKKQKRKVIGPQLPLWLWEEIAFSINQEPYWYTTIKLQHLMWQKRGNKLQYKGETEEVEKWEISSWEWKIEMQVVKQPRGLASPWQYKNKGEWKPLGQWYVHPGDYKNIENEFWLHWRVALCSCRKEKFSIREFMIGKHRWDLCRSCLQGEIIKHTKKLSLQRLALLHLAEEHPFVCMPLWRARRVPITKRFPWCRNPTGYTIPWSVQECWQMESIFE
uniref:Virion infectivity factor n=1 Tax=Small ruminant lentivirus TaxID=254355 RepID=A0A142J2Y7_CAEV|nr:vif [Small ruminant lentivirus]